MTTRPRLTKRDVERLLARYDDDPVGALAEALGSLLGRADANFDELIVDARVSEARTALLMAREQRALDELAAELNERRTLPL